MHVSSFSKKYPAFFSAIFIFLGCIFSLKSPGAFFLSVFFSLLIDKKFLFFFTLLFLFSLSNIYLRYDLLGKNELIASAIPENSLQISPIEVEGVFIVRGEKTHPKFSNSCTYFGYLVVKNKKIICRMTTKEPLDSSFSYSVSGKLTTKDRFNYVLKPLSIQVCKKVFSLEKKRKEAKKKLIRYVDKYFSSQNARQFIIALSSGELEDNFLRMQFSKAGLSHLLAVSGFHFGLLAAFFYRGFKLFLSSKITSCLLILLSTGYLLFLGMGPSIFRAWIFSVTLLFSQLVEKRSSPINTLGVAACIELVFLPLHALTLSFQLSYLATAGILFFFKPLEEGFNHLLPLMPTRELMKKRIYHQIEYFLARILLKSFSLILAVHLALLPLLLHAFHCFSLNSLLYNLFFPFLTALSILFFLVGTLLSFAGLPWLHYFNNFYTRSIMKLVEEPFLSLKTFFMKNFPGWGVGIYLTIVLLAAIALHEKRNLSDHATL